MKTISIIVLVDLEKYVKGKYNSKKILLSPFLYESILGFLLRSFKLIRHFLFFQRVQESACV